MIQIESTKIARMFFNVESPDATGPAVPPRFMPAIARPRPGACTGAQAQLRSAPSSVQRLDSRSIDWIFMHPVTSVFLKYIHPVPFPFDEWPQHPASVHKSSAAASTPACWHTAGPARGARLAPQPKPSRSKGPAREGPLLASSIDPNYQVMRKISMPRWSN